MDSPKFKFQKIVEGIRTETLNILNEDINLARLDSLVRTKEKLIREMDKLIVLKARETY